MHCLWHNCDAVVYGTLSEFAVHIRSRHQQITDGCPAVPINDEVLARHRLTACPHCNQAFVAQRGLPLHVVSCDFRPQNHDQPAPSSPAVAPCNSFACPVPGCNVRVAPNELARHVRARHSSLTFAPVLLEPLSLASCTNCNAVYTSRGVSSHFSSCHNGIARRAGVPVQLSPTDIPPSPSTPRLTPAQEVDRE